MPGIFHTLLFSSISAYSTKLLGLGSKAEGKGDFRDTHAISPSK